MNRTAWRWFFLSFILMGLLASNIAMAAGAIRVLGSLTQEKIAGGGDKYDGVVYIKNSGDAPCKVRLYLTDYVYYADGKNIYGAAGSIPASNANWITLSANYFTVPANETAPVNYSVQVPINSNLKGTYWSMLMVEPVMDSNSGETPGEKGKYTLGLQTLIRYGIQIVTNINETGVRKIEFLDKKIIKDKNETYLQLDIKNSGERWLNPLVSVQLFDKNGKLLGNFSSEKTRILPTCSVRHKILLPNVVKGKFKALIIVDNGDQYVFGANYDLVIE